MEKEEEEKVGDIDINAFGLMPLDLCLSINAFRLMLLEHFGLIEEAWAIKKAVDKSLKKGIVTPDLKENSQYGTNQVGDFIAHNIVDIEDDTLMNDENIDLGKSTII